MKNRSTVIFTGGFAGGLIGIAMLVLFAGRFAMNAIELTGNGDGALSATTGAFYLATILVALIGGAIVSAIAYGASATDDTATRFELAHILPFGLVTAVAAGYSVLRAGLGIAGDTAAGVITVRVAALGLSVLIAGIVSGMLVSWVVSVLAAKSIVGLEGEAAPAGTGALMKAATRAVMGPMLAIAVIAALAISFAQLLLAAEGVAAIAIFSGAAAVVLLGAAGASYLGGRNKDGAAS